MEPQEPKWTQEFIDSLQNPDLKKKLTEENQALAEFNDVVKDIPEEEAKAFDEWKLYLYYKPPFDWLDWIREFDEELRLVGYQVLHRRTIEEWANTAISLGNLQYAGDLMEPYDGGKFKAEASIANQRVQEDLERRVKNYAKKNID